MAEKNRTKTNINLKIDSELWDQVVGLAKFLKVDRMDLIEESLRDRMNKYPEKGKR